MSTPHPSCAPTPLHDVRKFDGETTGQHLVLLKPDASKAELLAKLRTMNANITYDWDFINAFAGASESCHFSSTAVGRQLSVLLTYIHCNKGFFDDASLNVIRSSASVQSIEEDGLVHAH